MINKFSLAALILALLVSSCATVMRGTTEDVVINYTPKDSSVSTSLNHTCKSSPCIVKVPRKEAFSVTASKPGYDSQTVHVGTKVSGRGAAGLAGNIVAGGIIGVGVDAATGASKDHYPNPVNIELLPEGSKPVESPALTPTKKPNSNKSAPTS